jgi:hypothetical protein
MLRKMEDYKKYHAGSEARKAYLNGDYDEDGGFGITFRCDYSPERPTEESLLTYILDPQEYVRAEAEAYIDSHQEDILSDFLANDMVLVEYAEIINNPLNPVHCVKRIMRAVSASSAKTVNVTISKDGVEFTFKAEANQFRSDCISNYSNWNIAAADRREFETRFGRHAHYEPNDIVRIEYARSVLYSKN